MDGSRRLSDPFAGNAPSPWMDDPDHPRRQPSNSSQDTRVSRTPSAIEAGASAPREPNSAKPPAGRRHRLSSTRRFMINACALIGLFFASLDSGIVSTSMLTISTEFKDFVGAPWVILAYLIAYMGFAIFLCRLSDIYGRRDVLLVSWLLFVCFSLGCGTANSMAQLIVCRAFQGIGGSGLYSLTQIILVEFGPVDKPSLVGTLIGVTLALSLVLSPILGGLISKYISWRWIFHINIPFGAVMMLTLAIAWPQSEDGGAPLDVRYKRKTLLSVDFVGAAALLCTCCFLIFGIQQAGAANMVWSDAAIILALAVAAISCIVFIVWQVLLAWRPWPTIRPIFPPHLYTNRVYMASLVVTLLTGYPYLALMVIIPERFQIIQGDNVLMAGIQLLPLLGACALGSMAGGALSSKRNLTSHTLVASAGLQLLGTGLLMTTDDAASPVAALYGYQILVGFGAGLCFCASTILSSLKVARRDLASAHGAVAQARILGGCIGIAVCTVVFSYHSENGLGGVLTEEQMGTLRYNPIDMLSWKDVGLRDKVREVYAKAFAAEVSVMVYVCAVMFVAALLTIERKPPSMASIMEHQKGKGPVLVQSGSGGGRCRHNHHHAGRPSHSSAGSSGTEETELGDWEDTVPTLRPKARVRTRVDRV